MCVSPEKVYGLGIANELREVETKSSRHKNISKPKRLSPTSFFQCTGIGFSDISLLIRRCETDRVRFSWSIASYFFLKPAPIK